MRLRPLFGKYYLLARLGFMAENGQERGGDVKTSPITT